MIYCLGMSRTGTTTFSDFLRLYQLNVIHYPSHIQLMTGAGDGASDIPVIPVYKDLDKMFKCKFIHLIRDNWIEEVEDYFIRKSNRPNQSKHQVHLRKQVYGDAYWNKKTYSDAYKKHNDDVADYFANKDNLLVMNIVNKQKPQKLLEFLDLPDNGYKFPKSNAREDTWNAS